MSKLRYALAIFLIAAPVFFVTHSDSEAHRWRVRGPTIGLTAKEIYFEYNSTVGARGSLRVHVSFDGQNWTRVGIRDPRGRPIFAVEGGGPYEEELGMTQLFFRGASQGTLVASS